LRGRVEPDLVGLSVAAGHFDPALVVEQGVVATDVGGARTADPQHRSVAAVGALAENYPEFAVEPADPLERPLALVEAGRKLGQVEALGQHLLLHRPL